MEMCPDQTQGRFAPARCSFGEHGAARSNRQMGLDDQLQGPGGLPGLGALGDRLIFQVYLPLKGGALGKLGMVPPDE